MGLISRFGGWIDRLSEEKATYRQMCELHETHVKRMDLLFGRVEVLELQNSNLHDICNKAMQDNLKLRDELNAIKAMAKIRGTENPRPDQQKFDGSQPWKRCTTSRMPPACRVHSLGATLPRPPCE